MDEIRRQRILVVDDALVQLEYYMAVLECDYDVITATSLNEAIDILNNDTLVDALACDLNLGRGSSGKDLLTWVSEHQPGLLSHSMIISGDPAADTDAYSVSVVMKPVKPDELLQAVNLLLEQPPKQTITAV